MNYILETSISAIMISFILYEGIRINMLNKDKNAIIAGLVSMLLLAFGLYLWIKNGLLLDYGTKDEINTSNAELMFIIAIISMAIGLLFIAVSIIKFMIWRVKKLQN